MIHALARVRLAALDLVAPDVPVEGDPPDLALWAGVGALLVVVLLVWGWSTRKRSS